MSSFNSETGTWLRQSLLRTAPSSRFLGPISARGVSSRTSSPSTATATGYSGRGSRFARTPELGGRRRLGCILDRVLSQPPEAERTRQQRDRDHAENDVHDHDRDVHADAEGEQRAPRSLATKEIEQQALLGTRTARRDREQRRQALRDLDEQRVVHGRRQVKGAEHEVDRREAKD